MTAGMRRCARERIRKVESNPVSAAVRRGSVLQKAAKRRPSFFHKPRRVFFPEGWTALIKKSFRGLLPLLWVLLPLAATAQSTTLSEAWVQAIQQRDADRLMTLLGAGSVDVNLVNDQGKTALMIGAQSGDRPLCAALIKAGAKINVTNANGGTPLMHAAVGGNVQIVTAMLDAGARPNVRAVNGWTALALASAKGHITVMERLLLSGADPNTGDVFGWTPLMHAVEQERTDAVVLLLSQAQTQVNQRNTDGVTALHRALAQGSSEISRLLVGAGASMDLEDESGRTPADYARETGNANILEDLSS